LLENKLNDFRFEEKKKEELDDDEEDEFPY
jgi:hypothetical protein